MAEVTIKQLAGVVGTPIERLLEQMSAAGLSQSSGDELITDHDKMVLLAYLRDVNSDKPQSTNRLLKKKLPKPKKIKSPKNRLLSNIEANEEGKAKEEENAVLNITPEASGGYSPRVFISYSYDSADHIKWVIQLASMLRTDGINAIIDKWYLHPGDPVTEFMEKHITNSDFVLIVCTEKYKEKSDKRKGGVGYEEAIISSDMLSTSNHRKYIPILKSNEYKMAAPITLHSKKYIDLSDENSFGESYRDLLLALYGRNPAPPPIGNKPSYINS